MHAALEIIKDENSGLQAVRKSWLGENVILA